MRPSRDAERMARFVREAKILASLNHPNIASIYGLEESGNIQNARLEGAVQPVTLYTNWVETLKKKR